MMAMLKLLNPHIFQIYSKKVMPVLLLLLCFLLSYGLYQSLIVSPIDYQQGEMVRMMYIHVPSAWMSLIVYTFIAICSFSTLVWKTKMSYVLAVAAAPIGAMFAMITLVTGSLWGKPIWGTWWVWDARLTSMLVLFFLYIGYIAVVSAGDDITRAAKPSSAIALIGFINVPIVKFSVDLWYSLHQPASVFKLSGPTIHTSMLYPLMIMFVGFIVYFVILLIMRANALLMKLKYENKI